MNNDFQIAVKIQRNYDVVRYHTVKVIEYLSVSVTVIFLRKTLLQDF